MKKLFLVCTSILLLTFHVQARSLKLIKTGGTPLIYNASNIPSIFFVPNFITPSFGNGGYSMEFQEVGLNSLKNWTEEFNLISRAITNDLEKSLSSVQYEILIEDDRSQQTPYIIGRQEVHTTATLPKIATGTPTSYPFGTCSDYENRDDDGNILYLFGNTNNYINHIVIHTVHGKMAYMKFADDLMFGSFIKPDYTFIRFTGLCCPNPGSSCGGPVSLPNSTTYHSPVPSCSTSNGNVLQIVTGLQSLSNTTNSIIVNTLAGSNMDRQTYAGIGDFVKVKYCNQLEISNLDVDGNNTHIYYGGTYGDKAIQADHRGIYLIHASNTSMSKMSLHHFGLDGMEITNASDNLSMNDCHFDFNGRVGFTWGGCTGLYAEKCSFSNTGKAMPTITSNPGAGIDIEMPGPSEFSQNGEFIECKFEFNYGQAVVNDAPNATLQPHVNNVLFDNCIFEDDNGYGIWVEGDFIRFKTCQIRAAVNGAGWGIIPASGTKFEDCNFYDKNSNGTSILEFANNGEQHYIVNIAGAQPPKQTQFLDCTFTIENPTYAAFNYNAGTANVTEQDRCVVNNCNFNFLADPTNSLTETFYGVNFKGKNSFNNSNTIGLRKMKSCNTLIEGNNETCNPNEFNLSGRIYYAHHDQLGNLLDLGHTGFSSPSDNNSYLNINIDDKSIFQTLKLSSKPNIKLGKNVTINAKAGSTLSFWYSDVQHNGRIQCENASFLEIKGSSFLAQQTDRPRFYISNSTTWGVNTVYQTIPNVQPIIYFSAAHFGLPASYFNTEYSPSFFTGNYPALIEGNSNIASNLTVSQLNSAVEFPGKYAFVKVPLLSASNTPINSKLYNLSNVSGDFGVQIKFKADPYLCNSNLNGQNLLWMGTASSTVLAINLDGITGKPRINLGSMNLTPISSNNTNYFDENCHTLALTRYNNVLSLYIDGQFVNSSASSQNVNLNSSLLNSFYIGADNQPPYNFKGWIGQVALWQRSLTPSEIDYNHQHKLIQNTTNLIADWEMEDASSSTVISDIAVNPANGNFVTTNNLYNANWLSKDIVGNCNITYGNFRPSFEEENQQLININSKCLLYPNPAKNKINLKIPTSNSITIVTIFDISGKLIKQIKFEATNWDEIYHLNLNGFANGAFIVKIANKDFTEYKNLVVQD